MPRAEPAAHVGAVSVAYSHSDAASDTCADVYAHAEPYPRAIANSKPCADLHPISCSFAPPNSKSVATTFARTVIGAHSVAYSRANTSTY